MRLFFALVFQFANAGLKDETVHKEIGVNGGEMELKNGAKVIIEKHDVVDRNSFSFAVITAGTVYEDKLQHAQGEEYLANSFTFSNGLVRRAMTSPIVLQKSTLNKNFDPLGSATTGNSSKVWDYHNETEAVGEYMTDYYLLKPQRNFHRPITVILPVKHELKSNYTYHVFVVSQEFSHHAPELSTEHVEHFFVEGWGFINSKEGSLELSGGFLKFETAIGGLFVAAQFRTENDPYALVGVAKPSAGRRFGLALVILCLIVLSGVLIYRFGFKRNVKFTPPPALAQTFNYLSWRKLTSTNAVV